MKKKVLLILVLTLLSACGNNQTTNDAVSLLPQETATHIPEKHLTVETPPAEILSVETLPEVSHSPASIPENTSETPSSKSSNPNEEINFYQYEAIVINNILIGAWDGKEWIKAETLYPILPDSSLYTIYIGNYDTLTDIGTKDIVWPIIDGAVIMKNADKHDNPLWKWQDYMALSSEEHIDFGFFEDEHPGNPIFQEWADEVCTGLGYPNLKLPVRKVYDVGINAGDKTYYIVADNDYADGQKGIIEFVRTTVDGTEQNLIVNQVFWDYEGPYYGVVLKYVCDLNHDGEWELITYMNGLGETIWGSYQVYALRNGEYVSVLEGGWFD